VYIKLDMLTILRPFKAVLLINFMKFLLPLFIELGVGAPSSRSEADVPRQGRKLFHQKKIFDMTKGLCHGV